jgi:hypothetical protein
MSTNLAYATPIHRQRADEPQLVPAPHRVRIVATRAQRRARPKLVYGLGAIAAIFAIFLTQLLITISLSSGAYKIDGLQATSQTLSRSASSLNEKLTTLGSSQNLEANARALGMVASSKAAFLQLSNGQVLGSASPAARVRGLTAEANGSLDSVPNSLLTDIPVIKPPSVLTLSTGSGHGGTNTGESGSNSTQSTQGNNAPVQTGTSTSPSTTSPNSGDLPSPVTH